MQRASTDGNICEFNHRSWCLKTSRRLDTPHQDLISWRSKRLYLKFQEVEFFLRRRCPVFNFPSHWQLNLSHYILTAKPLMLEELMNKKLLLSDIKNLAWADKIFCAIKSRYQNTWLDGTNEVLICDMCRREQGKMWHWSKKGLRQKK